MYTTFTFIVQIIVVVYLLLSVVYITTRDNLSKFLFKFIPLVLATLLILNAFNIVK